MFRKCVEVYNAADDDVMRVSITDDGIEFHLPNAGTGTFLMPFADCEPLADFLREAGEE